ncbi:M56 family metallopeptidase [Chryseobacterium sp. PET-29]|uniref:M56 family metallopeptidase n=1 Tax=Chryseobacterium sp. PET-29 TaxID=2983267 RepID=UPI0021E5EC0F|nr:M56 family metallopeptidase [Chryseobacterium sp. PET-29]
MMIILKIILGSSMLLAVYYMLLQKEKMYRFNRFYLMFSILFSYAVPFISIQSENLKPSNRIQTTVETTQQVLDITKVQENFNLINWLWIIYGTITLIFLIKLIHSFLVIKKMKGKSIKYHNQNILITKEYTSPFSFWNTIYLGENYLIDSKIDPRIFLHEKSHLEQKHSVDVIIIEILKAFTWFNPSIFFYRKAIITNHEFLADESVLKNDFNIKEYQNLILNEIILNQNYNLTHTFNFNNTKKRFIMMNTKKSKMTIIKKVISIPVLLITFGLFVQKTYAGNVESAAKIFPEIPGKDSENKAENFAEEHIKSLAKDGSTVEKTKDNPANNFLPSGKMSREKEKSTDKSSEIQPKIDSNLQTTTTVAEYPGGQNELRNKVASLFDASKITHGKEQKMMKTDITYTVDENGRVTNINAAGNNKTFNDEAVSAFKKANENVVWKPAEKDGKAVPYGMKMPLTMSFE